MFDTGGDSADSADSAGCTECPESAGDMDSTDGTDGTGAIDGTDGTGSIDSTDGTGAIDSTEWTFPADPGAVRTARTAVRGQLRSWGLDSLVDLTALLVSELVTNSLRHATGPIGVRLVRPAGLADVLLVEVSDPLPDPPRERPARPEDESGRGLQLVARSTRRWGTRAGDTGKTVWFELSVSD